MYKWKRNRRGKIITIKYQDKKKKQKKFHRNSREFQKEIPQENIWNEGGIVAKGTFGKNWQGNWSEKRE